MSTPEERSGLLITAYISSSHAPMTHYVICPVCNGRIGFNLIELQERKSKGQTTSVYCAGINEDVSDPKKRHYHPDFPPDPIYEFVWANG